MCVYTYMNYVYYGTYYHKISSVGMRGDAGFPSSTAGPKAKRISEMAEPLLLRSSLRLREKEVFKPTAAASITT